MKSTTYLGILCIASGIGGYFIGALDSPLKWLGLLPLAFAGWESHKFVWKPATEHNFKSYHKTFKGEPFTLKSDFCNECGQFKNRGGTRCQKRKRKKSS